MAWPITVCLLVGSTSAAPEWHLCGPGGGGWIQSLSYSPVDSQTLFVGCDVGGFYRSDNGGQLWRIQNQGLRDPYLEAVVPHPTDPNILYLGTESGLHRSDDGGQTWKLCRNGFPPEQRYKYSAPIACLVLDPQHPDTLYAGVGIPRNRGGGQGKIYRTTDGARSWELYTPSGALPDDAVISSLLVRPDGSVLIATQHGLYQSADGRTWSPRNEGLANTYTRYLAGCAADPQRLYVTVFSSPGVTPWDGGVYRSDDGGAHWRRVIAGLPNWPKQGDTNPNMTAQLDLIAVEPKDPNTVYVGGAAWVSAGVWKTTDGGEHWTAVFNRPREGDPGNVEVGYITFWGPSVTCLAIHPTAPGRLFFGTSGMVYETKDGGTSWQQLYTKDLGDGRWTGIGLEVTCLWDIACHPLRRDNWLLGYMDIGLWQTRDAGASLERCMTGVKAEHSNCGMAFAFDPVDPDRLWAGFGQWGSNRGGIYESADGGRSWSPLETPFDSQVVRILVDPTSSAADRRLWAAQREKGVVEGQAVSGGWRAINEGLPHGNIVALQALPGQPTTLLALLTRTKEGLGGLYQRRDGGPWVRLDQGEPFIADPQGLAVSPRDPSRVYLALRERYFNGKVYPGGCFASQDGGRTFQRVFEDHFIDTVAVNADGWVAIGGTDHPYHDEPVGCGVHLSQDGGQTWTDLTSDLSWPNVTELQFDPFEPHRLLAGTGGNSFSWRMIE